MSYISMHLMLVALAALDHGHGLGTTVVIGISTRAKMNLILGFSSAHFEIEPSND